AKAPAAPTLETKDSLAFSSCSRFVAHGSDRRHLATAALHQERCQLVDSRAVAKVWARGEADHQPSRRAFSPLAQGESQVGTSYTGVGGIQRGLSVGARTVQQAVLSLW